ncbi:MAG: hypothetical protein RLZZ546_1455, partial [Bacteroidota bacterium]
IKAIDAEVLHQLNRGLIEISMEDIFSPPVATRVFAYPNLAFYEVINHKKNISVINRLFPSSIKLSSDKNISYEQAATIAYLRVAKKLVFTEGMVDSLEQSLIEKYEFNKASIGYGESMANQINLWIDQDNYARVKADDFYSIKTSDSTWVLTPPAFDSALEPNWNKLRPIYLKNLKDFEASPKPKFDSNKNSEFYKYALEVYNHSKQKDSASYRIAKHWDCNPNEYNNTGHNTYFIHRISPPGHWVNITKLICKNNNANLTQTSLAYCAVTSAIFDGIISCWNTKYSMQLLRPVTFINKYIDKNWLPFIQTPPFPEYTSGHSVVSGASSKVLSSIFKNTSFVDDTEVEFGMPKRSFSSATEAGQEASLSRFYGGIHYRFGVENGFKQGEKIGNFIIDHLLKSK